MHHQFGSIVLMADAYRQELLADAARTRPISATDSSEGFVIGALPASVAVREGAISWRRRLGTLLVRVGLLLQGAQPGSRELPGPIPSAEVSAII